MATVFHKACCGKSPVSKGLSMREEDVALWVHALATEMEMDERVPEGWETARSLATTWGLRRTQSREYIARLLEKGVIERKDFRIMYRDSPRVIPHYRLAMAKGE